MDNEFEEYVKNSDDALFHYTKTSTAIEHILYTKKFKLSLLIDTNDPNEYKQKLFGSLRRPSLRETEKEEKQFEDLLKRAQYRIERIRRFECRVMCFCTNNKPILLKSDGNPIKDEYASSGWEKSRMWSQYGQNYYGICLVFSKKELETFLSKKKSHIKFYKIDSIEYTQQRPLWPNIFGNKLQEEGIEKYSLKYIKENYKKLFFLKHVDYRDEAELRLVILDSDKKFEYLDITSFIKGVIVGDRTSMAYIPSIYQFCQCLKIECLKASWYRNRPQMILGKCKIPKSI